jgi:hypothetical protein
MRWEVVGIGIMGRERGSDGIGSLFITYSPRPPRGRAANLKKNIQL